ncbi:MAG: NAD-dependent epimerase/dehydratase family protein, partial [Muribaculaceae bacterium]|nr:NAD-dependent epimerase/dehydratase family protein [Muribaculaceae bacterium]
MKKVVVTGADGFIGSHLTEALLNEGCEVKALAQYNSFNNWGWLEGISHPSLPVSYTRLP